MDLITLDFETRWGVKYSIKKLTTVEYVTDHRFKAFMCGVKINDGPTRVFPHEQLRALFKAIDWSRVCVLCHNACFDGYILEWRYGAHPAFYMDTQAMSRWLHGKRFKGHSLAEVSKQLKVGEKGKELVQSKDLEELDPATYEALAGYCAQDVELTWAAAQKMLPLMPPKELKLINWSIGCFLRPHRGDGGTVTLDLLAIERMLKAERARKKARIEATGYKPADMRSADKFKAILEEHGVTVEMKPGKKKPIPALAKTDDFMRTLLTYPDDKIRELAEARVSLRSSYAESRLERFRDLGRLTVRTPVMMTYCGAQQTARWSGGEKCNFQNLGKHGKLKELRTAVATPPECKIVAGDLSQIEARVLDTLAGNEAAVELYRRGGDPYIPLAAKYYSKLDQDVSEEERAFGKVLKLAAGYQMGGPKFFETCKNWGVEGVSEDEAIQAIRVFRDVNAKVTDLWSWCHNGLPAIAEGADITHPSGLFELSKHTIHVIPTRFNIKYPKLRKKSTDRGYSWEYYDATKRYWTNIYGGKMVENIVQHLASRIVADQMLNIGVATGRWPAFMVHDELDYVIEDAAVDEFIGVMNQHMSTPPTWWPDLPVACEVKAGVNFGEV